MFKISTLFILSLLIYPNLLPASSFSVNIGMNHSWLINPEFSESSNKYFNPGFSLSTKHTHCLSESIDFSFGIRLFSVGNFDKVKLSTIYSTEETTESEINLIYISSPIQLDYKLVPKLITVINFEPSINLNSKYTLKNDFFNEKTDITKDIESFNFFIGLGLKYILDLHDHRFEIFSLYNYGLMRTTKIQKVDENQIGGWADLRAREFLVSIGYYF